MALRFLFILLGTVSTLSASGAGLDSSAHPQYWEKYEIVNRHIERNRHQSALLTVDSMQDLAGSDSALLARLDYFRGKIYTNWGYADRSLSHLTSALQYFRKSGDREYQARIYMELGFWKANRKKAQESLDYYEKAYRIFGELGMSEAQYKARGNMGIQYLYAFNDLDRSHKAYRDVMNYARKAGDSSSLMVAFVNIARVHFYKEQYDSAFHHFKSVANWAAQGGDSLLWADGTRGMAEVYDLRGRRKLAASLWKQCLEVYDRHNQKRRAFDTYTNLIKNLEERRLYQEANQYLREYYRQSDSLYNTEKEQLRQQLEKKLELVELEHQLALMSEQERSERRQKFLYLSLSALALTGSFLGVVKWRNQKRLRHFEGKVYEGQRKLEMARRRKLQEELQQKERALANESLRIIQKNQQFEELQQKFKALHPKLVKAGQREWVEMNSALKFAMSADKEWEEFSSYFQSIHPRFNEAMERLARPLTLKEKRLSALMRIGMTSREMSSVLGISPDSVKKARTRLRKKLGLSESDDLYHYLLSLEQEYSLHSNGGEK